jgi:hypothetical protein
MTVERRTRAIAGARSMVGSSVMGVGELLSVKAKLTDAVTGNTVEDVVGLVTVGIEVELTVPTDELVTSEGFDSFDSFLDFHGWSFLYLLS